MLRISDLLGHPRLGLEAVDGAGAGSGEGDGDRLIRWVHVTELPDPRPYIGEDELVLTNGLWLAEEDCSTYARRLASAGASGLVFGLRAATPAVPDGLAAACREAGLPLLRLPIDVPFTAVTQVVATAQAEHRQRQLLDALRHSDELTSTISAGHGLRGVLNVLAGLRRVPVALVDRLGECVDAIRCPLSADDLRQVAAYIADGAQERPLTLSGGSEATVIP
ncbi:PucR family transcriptional regulator ligand-binding domain-containing protein, partial [Streptomyces pathocidini]